jgi:hypothetical protein
MYDVNINTNKIHNKYSKREKYTKLKEQSYLISITNFVISLNSIKKHNTKRKEKK